MDVALLTAGIPDTLGKCRAMNRFKTYLWAATFVLLSASFTGAQEHQHHDFGDIETWIQRFEDPARELWQKPDQVVGLLNLLPGQNVADVGAGTGYFTRRMAEQVIPGGIALAVDIEPGFFPYIDKRAVTDGQDNIFIRKAEIDNPRLGVAIFDLIFICNTLHHIDHRAEYFAWLQRALRSGGRVVVVDFFKDMEIPVGPKPAMRLSHQSLKAEFVAAGFSVDVDVETLPYQYILTATLRQ